MAALAAAQHGVFARWQLRGVTDDVVHDLIERGAWYRVLPLVYSLTPSVTLRGRMMAAALTFGPHAVLSHRAAAAIWDIGPWPSGLIDVTVPGRAKPRPGIRLHRARVEKVIKDGFPVTTVARALIDQATHLPLGRLRDQFENADRLGLLDVTSDNEQIQGRRGAKKIRAIFDAWSEPQFTRRELEKAFRDLCEEAGIAAPRFNVLVCGFEVDAFWEADAVVVELDSWQFHKTRAAFERDRERGAVLAAAGYRLLPFTWRQLTRRRDEVVRKIRSGCPTAAGRGPSPARAGARRSSGP